MTTRALNRTEVWEARERWRKVFAAKLHRVSGRWTLGTGARDVFHRAFMSKFLRGAKAEAEYASPTGEFIYVIEDESDSGALYDCRREAKPPLGDLTETRQVVIFPESLEWSACTGKEVWDPVYFTYRDWVDDDADFENA